MSKRKAIVVAGIVIAVVIGIVGYRRITGQKNRIPEYVFDYADNQPEDYPTTLAAKYFAELVEERSDGRIQILVQSGGGMGAEQEVLRQMQYGGIDFARISLSSLTECEAELNLLQMPYLYTDSEHMWRVLDGEIGDYLLENVKESGVIGLSWYDAGARSFYNAVRPVRCLEDLEGLKIRVPEGGILEDAVNALGAEAVPMDYADVYSGIERSIVDGAENNWPSYETMNHYEVAKYYTLDEHTRIPEMQLCSKHTWDKLDEEDQKLIQKCAKESALYERELWAEREKESKKIVLQRGVELIELSDQEKRRFREAMEGVYEKYCGEYMELLEKIIEEGKETD